MLSAEEQVLAKVRGMSQGVVMRVLSPRHPMFRCGKCAVLDVLSSNPVTPNYSAILYQADTWDDVLAMMTKRG